MISLLGSPPTSDIDTVFTCNKVLDVPRFELENLFLLQVPTASAEVASKKTGHFIQTAAGAKKKLKTLFLSPCGAENFFK